MIEFKLLPSSPRFASHDGAQPHFAARRIASHRFATLHWAAHRTTVLDSTPQRITTQGNAMIEFRLLLSPHITTQLITRLHDASHHKTTQ